MFQDIAPHKFYNQFYKDAIRPEDVVLCQLSPGASASLKDCQKPKYRVLSIENR